MEVPTMTLNSLSKWLSHLAWEDKVQKTEHHVDYLLQNQLIGISVATQSPNFSPGLSSTSLGMACFSELRKVKLENNYHILKEEVLKSCLKMTFNDHLYLIWYSELGHIYPR